MARSDKKRQIMQAAERLFAAGRFHETTTDDVARAARVGKGTIYRYFKDKDDLFFETANSGFDDLCDLLAAKVPAGAPFREQLGEACTQITRFFTRRSEWFGLVLAQERLMPRLAGRFSRQWAQRRGKLVDAVAGIVRVGIAEGAVRGDWMPEVLANFLLGLLRTRDRDLENYPARMRADDVVLDMFCRGACPNGQLPSPRTRQRRGKDSSR